ncbi:MAG TPA: SSI family serine proteinase inhibitor, partial [Gaiellaceae bacterium]|nr:SSI family serine proteinase inhibitor [Gaiellaceae bacterium]
MRWAVVLVFAAAALGACGAGSAGTTTRTALTITYWENGIGKSEPVRWTLRCNPARGTLSRPAVACRRLAAGGVKLFAPIPPSTVCTQIYGGPQVARVVGRVAGKRIWTTFTRNDGCQIGRWNRVSPWLLPPGG